MDIRRQALDLTTYDEVASEYYDSARHPTCANFGELSERFIAPRLTTWLAPPFRILEVGAGRSIVAPRLAKTGGSLQNLTLLDHSPAMLAHSRQWAQFGATLMVADARATGLPPASFDLIVAALGDPYNDATFWAEVERILTSGGVCLFTTPAWEWSVRFRHLSARTRAEFLLERGETVAVPSLILAVEDQFQLIAAAGLTVQESEAFTATGLSSPRSPKLNVFQEGEEPVVRGFTVQKR
jgi:SAM-dependent methyltransferase